MAACPFGMRVSISKNKLTIKLPQNAIKDMRLFADAKIKEAKKTMHAHKQANNIIGT